MFKRKSTYVNPRDLIIPVELYQRDPMAREKKIRRMAEKWDNFKARTIDVNIRKDGKMYVMDGAGRVTAAIIAGINKLDAVVYEGMTPEDESKFFVDQILPTRLTSLDYYKAMLAHGDETAVQIRDLLEKFGLEANNAGTKNSFQAIGSIYSFLKTGNTIKLVEAGFQLIDDVWGLVNDNPRVRHGQLVRAMMGAAAMIERGDIDRKTLIYKLQSVSVEKLYQTASAISIECGIGAGEAMRQAVLKIYNKGKRVKVTSVKRIS